MAETSKHGKKTEKMPSDWRWLVRLLGSRNSCKYLHIGRQQPFSSET